MLQSRENGLKRLLNVHAIHGGMSGDYIRADYLECYGGDAIIDTGVSGDDETLRFLFDYVALDKYNWWAHFGNYVDENTKCWRVIQSNANALRVYIVDPGNRKAGSSASFNAVSAETGTIIGTRMTFDLSYGKCKCISADGTVSNVTTETDSSPANSTNIAIGNRNLTPFGYNIKGRFWYFKIWSGGKLIRDYVPCIRKSDSKAGFYDLANGTFNPSIGPADFVAGMDT